MVSIRLLNNVMQTEVCGVALRLIFFFGPGDDDGFLALSEDSVNSLRSNGIHLEIASGRSTLKREIRFEITTWEGLSPKDGASIAKTVIEGMSAFRKIIQKTMQREGIEAQVAGWFSQN